MHRSTPRSLAVLFSLLMLLAGCGQKGPLYLPDETGQSGSEQPNDDDNNTDSNN